MVLTTGHAHVKVHHVILKSTEPQVHRVQQQGWTELVRALSASQRSLPSLAALANLCLQPGINSAGVNRSKNVGGGP